MQGSEWLKIDYSKKAVKYINLQDRVMKQRLKVAIEGLTEVPPLGDIKSLQGYNNKFRLRVGGVRVLFRYFDYLEEDVSKIGLYIIDIDSRGGIYK